MLFYYLLCYYLWHNILQEQKIRTSVCLHVFYFCISYFYKRSKDIHASVHIKPKWFRWVAEKLFKRERAHSKGPSEIPFEGFWMRYSSRANLGCSGAAGRNWKAQIFSMDRDMKFSFFNFLLQYEFFCDAVIEIFGMQFLVKATTLVFVIRKKKSDKRKNIHLIHNLILPSKLQVIRSWFTAILFYLFDF